MPETETPVATSYYNGACPVCSAEIKRYRADAKEAAVRMRWVDISQPENQELLADYGITQDMAYRRMVVVDQDGVPRIGVDGFVEIWRQLPRWRWAAKLVSLPIIASLSRWTYDHIAARAIYEWNKRRLRRAKAGPSV